ncbi:TetR/AcrR family transcriptional regulator (plasmid) [Rhizobium sullae]|uniref:TetR/AcrR family transcriptional regulator n=1 Tax=Rhizobium sullae TaxID=50338 RepID=A0ABY5XS82_RHISU|nr:TetR/AcrR family transcriptional regulator [Rhizobium sullae]UWU17492.1 TetR/AcrR family transcriptional regulator [Rhizobium sullae]
MKSDEQKNESSSATRPAVRADARRNFDALLQAAMAVFSELGVDAPMRTIADRAGVGVGTLYRHFPERSDLIKALIKRDVLAQADAAAAYAEELEPAEALAKWMTRLVDFISTKKALGPALHSGDPAYQALPEFVLGQFTPVLRRLLDAAAASGAIRNDVNASDLLNAGLRLATPSSDGDTEQARRMVSLLTDGLRHRPNPKS